MIVSYHGLNGIGNKMMSNHLSHPELFREDSSRGRASRAAFPGVAIAVEGSKFRVVEANSRVCSQGTQSF